MLYFAILCRMHCCLLATYNYAENERLAQGPTTVGRERFELDTARYTGRMLQSLHHPC